VVRGYLGGGACRGTFRTRDRVKRGRGGAYVFLGRGDRQVKFRGWRVEPAEIEAVLDAVPGVGRSVVVPGPDGFVAHLEGARAVGLATVKARLAAVLPPHMTVNRLVFHPRGLPRTPRGKLDLRKLTP
jgi:acyl-coenzyme A synthetase/AMP-(fatty) acid ligase